MIDHIQLVVKDLESSKKFYLPIFETLQIPVGGQGPDFFWVDELFVSTKESKAATGSLTGRVHLAFQAKDRAMVDKFYEVAMKSGGKDNGKPGERPYHPGYYGAFVIDPDGNNIEAVFHGPAKKSSEAIKITF
ncbi:VOC family protein [Bdellovibrio sp. SKB1291214]|uniref:VOC family protein n=1 Tax=Bdellovibrio sp. SKB1291214 TaxID=1732569 RepID=UPI0020CC69A5|nr:VOC family protein [Bdellovibrio sp. SKB1291214]UYL10736.1 VOC family protein [Bdellovibrio sp. SKB1291214]